VLTHVGEVNPEGMVTEWLPNSPAASLGISNIRLHAQPNATRKTTRLDVVGFLRFPHRVVMLHYRERRQTRMETHTKCVLMVPCSAFLCMITLRIHPSAKGKDNTMKKGWDVQER
jgi:hypothetical protein